MSKYKRKDKLFFEKGIKIILNSNPKICKLKILLNILTNQFHQKTFACMERHSQEKEAKVQLQEYLLLDKLIVVTKRMIFQSNKKSTKL